MLAYVAEALSTSRFHIGHFLPRSLQVCCEERHLIFYHLNGVQDLAVIVLGRGRLLPPGSAYVKYVPWHLSNSHVKVSLFVG